MEGWICLYRQILDWEWYSDANTFRLFIHLLLSANHEEKRWQGIVIKRGELVTSYGNLAETLKLSVQAIRTSINKLKSTSEITTKTTNKFSLVSIVNWELYQTDTEKVNNKWTSNEHQMDIKWTQTRKIKNIKNILI